MTREDVVGAARGWLGTPYRHQASKKGVGADCLGLLRGVWCEMVGDEPETPPPYTSDWAEALGRDTLIEAARRYLQEIPVGAAAAGDVLVFRMAMGVPAKHCAIISSETTMIHAYWARAVVESRRVAWWERRIAAAFRFPGLEE